MRPHGDVGDADRRLRHFPRVRRLWEGASPQEGRLLRLLLIRIGAVSVHAGGTRRLADRLQDIRAGWLTGASSFP